MGLTLFAEVVFLYGAYLNFVDKNNQSGFLCLGISIFLFWIFKTNHENREKRIIDFINRNSTNLKTLKLVYNSSEISKDTTITRFAFCCSFPFYTKKFFSEYFIANKFSTYWLCLVYTIFTIVFGFGAYQLIH